MQEKLAILGGRPVRDKAKSFAPRPYISEEAITGISQLLRSGVLTRFIGSPVSGFKDHLTKTSSELLNIQEGFTVVGGSEVRGFEAGLANLAKCQYAVTFNSATSALQAGLLSLNLSPGDAVIVSPFSFTASCSSIVAANLVPIFCDIDLDTFCLDPNKIPYEVLKNSSAVMPIHWNGNAGDLAGLLNLADSFKLKFIEDASQAIGNYYNKRPLGSIGDVGVYSFNEPKNITTGEGGALLTHSKDIAIKSRMIRNHGEALIMEDDSISEMMNVIGFNFRMLEPQALLGRYQLNSLDKLNAIRKNNYEYLLRGLKRICGECFIEQKITNDSYFPYTMGLRWLDDKSGIPRNLLGQALRAEGVPVATGVARLMSDHPMFTKQIAYGTKGFPFSLLKSANVKINLDNARLLQDRQYLGFFQLGYPYDCEDMDDILGAFDKIMRNKMQLLSSNLNIDASFVSGR